jgi:hypothetical protein
MLYKKKFICDEKLFQSEGLSKRVINALPKKSSNKQQRVTHWHASLN